ncbi:VOC family protein [Caldimonas tepidiphila]|uniref:VOC family protein n=1 Tax=Caldimonas tepidiphila TaxID=2315841 RepID=UPI000E5A762E|nr:VOC family protein [Caldimonas tepidiphila]
MIDIRALAYVVAQTTSLQQWKRYAEEVLGMMTAPAPDGGLYVRMDERQFRFAVQEGPRNAYLATGWEVADRAAYEAALQALRAAGVEVTPGDAALCRLRCVQQLAAFSDPSGNRHELVWGFKSDFRHFASPVGVSRFVTGSMGMGHVVLPAPELDATQRFFRDVLGFGLSDIYNFQPQGEAGPTLPIHFLHCGNARHHSLALAGFPVPSGCVHVMVEVESMPEVGRAMDRMHSQGITQTATLGQHTNDRMISFYMRSPSGFDIEFGFGGAVVDWREHIVHEFTRVSLWGHDFSIANAGDAQ